MSDLNRLRWRCRRGTLELDLVLNRFLEQEFAQLDAAAQQQFMRLLEMGDEALWALISDASHPVPHEAHSLLTRLRAC